EAAGADLLSVDLPVPDLSDTDLPGTDLPGTDLSGTDLPGTDLSGTDLSAAPAADLAGADLRAPPDLAPYQGIVCGDATCIAAGCSSTDRGLSGTCVSTLVGDAYYCDGPE